MFTIVIAAGSSIMPAIKTIALLAFGPLIISLTTASNNHSIRNFLKNRILVVLGGASYTFYLLQFPLRKYMVALVPDHLGLYARIAFAPVLICVSVFVFLYFEGPMRKMLRQALDPLAEVQPQSRG